MRIDKLNKKYSPKYQKVRRVWVNLFRPIRYGSRNPIYAFHPITYIMLATFAITAIMTVKLIPFAWIPFVSAFTFTAISLIYFRFFPLSWEEMSDYEKEAYRFINQLPSDWNA